MHKPYLYDLHCYETLEKFDDHDNIIGFNMDLPEHIKVCITCSAVVFVRTHVDHTRFGFQV